MRNPSGIERLVIFDGLRSRTPGRTLLLMYFGPMAGSFRDFRAIRRQVRFEGALERRNTGLRMRGNSNIHRETPDRVIAVHRIGTKVNDGRAGFRFGDGREPRSIRLDY